MENIAQRLTYPFVWEKCGKPNILENQKNDLLYLSGSLNPNSVGPYKNKPAMIYICLIPSTPITTCLNNF